MGGKLKIWKTKICYLYSITNLQEFEDIWDKLDIIVDGGTLSNSPQSRSGSTIVDLSKPGEFSIVRDGCAYDTVLSILEGKYQLRNTTLKWLLKMTATMMSIMVGLIFPLLFFMINMNIRVYYMDVLIGKALFKS